MRKEHTSYDVIAAWITEHGLPVSRSAVHAYVRARARPRRDPYSLPCTSIGHPPVQSSSPALEHGNGLNGRSVLIEESESAVSTKFIFSPSTKVEEPFDDKKFTFNDPLDPSHDYE